MVVVYNINCSCYFNNKITYIRDKIKGQFIFLLKKTGRQIEIIMRLKLDCNGTGDWRFR